MGQQELAIEKQISIIKDKYEQKEKGFEFIKTPKCNLVRYYELEDKIKFANKKAKKAVSKEMMEISKDKAFQKDYSYFKEYLVII